jgi:RNA polymerase sigma-70 factor (ECF subfamily)
MATRDDDWGRLVAGLRAGDPDVAREFCDRFGPALGRVADQRLPTQLRRRLGAEDVVQSACRTFLRRAQEGEFRLADDDSLWQLMCAITLTKLREHVRFHMRRKRGVDLEEPLAPAPAGESGEGPPLAASGPTPDEAAEFADQFSHLLEGLDPEERLVVQLRFEEFTNDQIATSLNCSERTVRRLLKRVQNRLKASFSA